MKGDKMKVKKWLADPEAKRWMMEIIKWLVIIILGTIAFRITNGVINKLAEFFFPTTLRLTD